MKQKIIDGISYRIARARYNGKWIEDCLIPENGYQVLKKVKPAKSDNKKLSDELDEMWSESVKVRDGYKCRKCGSVHNLNSHHIFTRSNKAGRWLLENGITLCAGCHILNYGSAHKTPELFREWLIGEMGQKEFDKLMYKVRLNMKVSKSDLEMVRLKLSAYLKQNK